MNRLRIESVIKKMRLENHFKENANTSEYRQQIFKTVGMSENYICTN